MARALSTDHAILLAVSSAMEKAEAEQRHGDIREDDATSTSSDGPAFEPIRTRKTRDTAEYHFRETDFGELARIASMLSKSQSQPQSQSQTGTSKPALERKDTVAGMAIDSPEFNPDDKSFNFFLWMRSKHATTDRYAYLALEVLTRETQSSCRSSKMKT